MGLFIGTEKLKLPSKKYGTVERYYGYIYGPVEQMRKNFPSIGFITTNESEVKGEEEKGKEKENLFEREDNST